MGLTIEWRGAFTNDEVNRLHAEAFEHELCDDGWQEQVHRWSLGWVTARDVDGLVGFVNIPWDGRIHAFIIDPIVAIRARSSGSAGDSSRSLPRRRASPAASGSMSTSTTNWRRSTSRPAVSSRPRLA